MAQNENYVPFDAPFCRRRDWKYKTEVNASKNSKVVVIARPEYSEFVICDVVYSSSLSPLFAALLPSPS